MSQREEPATEQTAEDVDVAANLADVLAAVSAAAIAAGREPGDAGLVAVSKTQSADAALAAIRAGQRRFGENRVQEAQGKWPALKADHADLRLHLIGPLQTNKVRDAVALFDVIETVDRPKLARALAKEMEKQGQINREERLEIRKRIRNKGFKSQANLKEYIKNLRK